MDLPSIPHITPILITIAAALIFTYIYQLYNFYHYWKKRKVPDVMPMPFFGNFGDLATQKRNLSEQLIHLYNQHNTPYIGIFIFGTPYLLLRDPKIIKRVLVKDFNIFSDRKTSANEKVDPITFHTLLSAKGSAWRAMRTKMSPVFTSGKMKLMMPLISTCTEELLELLETKKGEIIDVKEIMSKFTIDVISLCAFGIKAYSLQDDNSIINKMARQLIDPNSLLRTFSLVSFFFIPLFTNLFRLTFADKESLSFFADLFKETMERRKRDKIVKNDFVDLLNNLKNLQTEDDAYKFDDVKLSGQAISFFVAGNDTTSTILSFLINEITLQPDIQDRLRSEVDDLVEETGELTYDNLQRLKYMDMVIKETLRKYPLAPMLIRKSNQAYTFEETGLEIEKDTPILVPISGLHYDPEYYPEPEKFDPERFSQENKANIVPFTYLPFGEGPRFCIGERFAYLVMRVALFNMIKNYEFVKCEKTQNPIEINKLSAFLLPKNGVPVRIFKRSR